MRSLLLLSLVLACTPKAEITKSKENSAPDFIMGQFEDDYSIRYTISDSLFTMEDHTKLHIMEWNPEEQYFIGQNDSLNPYDPLLYSRIDWVQFEGMDPYHWGFCMSAYNAISLDSARLVSGIDREHPKTGCGGYPFSRMKEIATSQ